MKKKTNPIKLVRPKSPATHPVKIEMIIRLVIILEKKGFVRNKKLNTLLFLFIFYLASTLIQEYID